MLFAYVTLIPVTTFIHQQLLTHSQQPNKMQATAN